MTTRTLPPVTEEILSLAFYLWTEQHEDDPDAFASLDDYDTMEEYAEAQAALLFDLIAEAQTLTEERHDIDE